MAGPFFHACRRPPPVAPPPSEPRMLDRSCSRDFRVAAVSPSPDFFTGVPQGDPKEASASSSWSRYASNVESGSTEGTFDLFERGRDFIGDARKVDLIGDRADAGLGLTGDAKYPRVLISVRVIAASAVAGRTPESRLACLARAVGVPTSRVRPPPPPKPTPTGALPSSTPFADSKRPRMGSCLGATDVPKLARTDGDVALLGRPSRGIDRATEESNPRRSARSASPSARVASLLAAPVLFASCVRRFDTTPGSVLSALGGSRRNVAPAGSPSGSTTTVNACRPGPAPPSGCTNGTKHSSPKTAGVTKSPNGTSRNSYVGARRQLPPPLPDLGRSGETPAVEPPESWLERRLWTDARRSSGPPTMSGGSTITLATALTLARPTRTKNTPFAWSPAATIVSPGFARITASREASSVRSASDTRLSGNNSVSRKNSATSRDSVRSAASITA
mmetsp:Transcript_11373/g.52834  ORF Transcript_11373/g.52834 Transcript_11373/m.52834 type:complete len:449 (+) Transcript_11373:317-1663(+)